MSFRKVDHVLMDTEHFMCEYIEGLLLARYKHMIKISTEQYAANIEKIFEKQMNDYWTAGVIRVDSSFRSNVYRFAQYDNSDSRPNPHKDAVHGYFLFKNEEDAAFTRMMLT
jgi:hypothetical protein